MRLDFHTKKEKRKKKKRKQKEKQLRKNFKKHSIRLFSYVIPRRIIVAGHENTSSTKTSHSSTPNSSCIPPHNLSIMSTFFALGTRIRPVIITFTL
jgi:hypothetical protein